MTDDTWTTQPNTTGWYEVQWEPDEVPMLVWLQITPADDMGPDYDDAHDFVVWGFDEHDDLEAIRLGEFHDHQFPRCRPVTRGAHD
jgi:hypothetical protein